MERDFKGVWIPKAIWLDNRLNALDKVILTEIDSLDQGESGCYASNKYIAEFCQCSERKVSDAITKLTKLGYIKLTSFESKLGSYPEHWGYYSVSIFFFFSQQRQQLLPSRLEVILDTSLALSFPSPSPQAIHC